MKITIELKFCGPDLKAETGRPVPREVTGYYDSNFLFSYNYSHHFIVPYRKFNQKVTKA